MNPIRDETLRQMMEFAEETARQFMTTSGQVPGRFYCKGTHGNIEFAFENPTDDKSRAILFHRAHFNTLGVNGIATVMVFEGRVNQDPKWERALANAAGRQRPDQEAILVVGETGRWRMQRALFIERDEMGSFKQFGKTWDAFPCKMQGLDARFVAGIELRESERESALDQAGNLAMLAELEKRKARQHARGVGR